jgi:hypothetical protein
MAAESPGLCWGYRGPPRPHQKPLRFQTSVKEKSNCALTFNRERFYQMMLITADSDSDACIQEEYQSRQALPATYLPYP